MTCKAWIMKQKLTKRSLYWQKLSDLLMLLHFFTRFIRTSTVHNTTQSSFTQSLSKMKDEMPPRAYSALWYAPPSGHATFKKNDNWPMHRRKTDLLLQPQRATSFTWALTNIKPFFPHSNAYLCSARLIVSITHQHDNTELFCIAIYWYACYVVGFW